MDTVAHIRIRVADGHGIRATAREFGISRNTVRKALVQGEAGFVPRKRKQRSSILDPFKETLDRLLVENSAGASRDKRDILSFYSELQGIGYIGSYSTVQRYVQKWDDARPNPNNVFVPLVFSRGESYQFDWSEELVEISGVATTVQVAHFRLCYSRMSFVVAYPRQSIEMVQHAHNVAYSFFDGLCTKGIYDNPKTIVYKILKGKQRQFNHRFWAMASHYLVKPVACTPSSGWEKGQVERQVEDHRARIFTPRLKFESLEALNTHLKEQCVFIAKTKKHPEFSDKTIYSVYEEEKPMLRKVTCLFDGYVLHPKCVNSMSQVTFDMNHYSVPCEFSNKRVDLRIYADRVAISSDGVAIAEHKRLFGRNKYACNFIHYIKVAERKPGVIRNGRPFIDGDMPQSLCDVREYLMEKQDGDRQFAKVLSAILTSDLEAVEVACQLALESNLVNDTIILNAISRMTEEPAAKPLPPQTLPLQDPPVADCRRYDALCGGRHAA